MKELVVYNVVNVVTGTAGSYVDLKALCEVCGLSYRSLRDYFSEGNTVDVRWPRVISKCEVRKSNRGK